MKKSDSVVNAQQFHLTFTQQRPKSCVGCVHTKKTSESPAKENHGLYKSVVYVYCICSRAL